MFDKRISITTLGVKDLVTSTTFYEKLGWQKSAASMDTITFIQLKGIVLGLFPIDELAKDAGVTNDKATFSGTTMAHNLVSEKEVDDAMLSPFPAALRRSKHLKKCFGGGIRAILPIQTAIYGNSPIIHSQNLMQTGISYSKSGYLIRNRQKGTAPYM